ncbi:tetratricopeptide repeat protein [Kitasatospora sp. NPDC089509]|uniref:tetratricopeptide repeat protein n=1 Tax=Kitasatospora sp. NPDC089509 TaxID=3364079 RepID=UPI00381302EF
MTPAADPEPSGGGNPGERIRSGHHTVEQRITVAAGYGYGVVGADLHVFGDGLPLYLLENYRPAGREDPDRLAELPSRMLDARFAVVAFTGRAGELRQLEQWRDGRPRLVLRWLHAPGGQGKTRLARHFAQESLAAGWKVLTAVHGPGSVLTPGRSEDLRPDGSAGLLLIVDYADRWPQSHLTWLLSNALLHRPEVPTRVLLLARTLDPWPPLRAALAERRAELSSQRLEPLGQESGQRAEMFAAARTAFAARYGMADPSAVLPPGPLESAEYGLTLAVHMAALVAVDAHRRGRRPPSDPAGLTGYLLDREQLHWARLAGDGTHELGPARRTLRTRPAVMYRAVFTAALTGAMGRSAGAGVLAAQRLPPSPEQVLADHAACYPPADPARDTVLEPLYPDRLAEDLLALTLPGHPADYPAQDWAPATAALLLRAADGAPPPWTPRAIAFLAAAAARWPHLGPGYLFPLLLREPRLALAAGSAALTALAGIPDVGIDVLEAVAVHFPGRDTGDLAVGVAAVTRGLAERQLARTQDPAHRAQILFDLGGKLASAGQYEASAEASGAAAALYRQLTTARPVAGPSAAPGGALRRSRGEPAFLRLIMRRKAAAALGERRELQEAQGLAVGLAYSLVNLSTALARLGRWEEAANASHEAVAAIRATFRPEEALRADVGLGGALVSLAVALGGLGRYPQELDVLREAVDVLRHQARKGSPPAARARLANALSNHGVLLGRSARKGEALKATEEAVRIQRALARDDPSAHASDLAAYLNNLGRRRADVGDRPNAVRATEEAVGLLRRLAEVNPAVHRPQLARALGNLAQQRAGDTPGALAAAEEAVRILREQAAGAPEARPGLATSLATLAGRLSEAGRHHEAVAAAEEAVTLLRPAAEADPAVLNLELAIALGVLAQVRANACADTAGIGAAREALVEAEAVLARAATTTPAPAAEVRRQLQALKERLAARDGRER